MAKVSRRRVGFDSVFCFRASLKLFSGCPMLRVPPAISEKKTIFGRFVSNPLANRIKGLGQVHKEDVQALILLAAFSLIFPTANIMSIVHLFLLKAH